MSSRKRRRGPGRPTNPISRSEILQTARVAFASKGYDGASTAYLAGQLGLTKGSLFHHFPSKENLYLEVMKQIFIEIGNMIEAAQLDDDSFRIRLRRLNSLVADYLGDNPAVASLLLQSQVLDTPLTSDSGRKPGIDLLHFAGGFLEAGMAAGEFRLQDSRHLLLSIIGCHLYYFATAPMTSELMECNIFAPEA
ncbi:MAG: hypothetical protein CMH53_05670, partial [Myxococcales bacterium]|nr:hypothetical protein [Myxococcales bacterium]